MEIEDIYTVAEMDREFERLSNSPEDHVDEDAEDQEPVVHTWVTYMPEDPVRMCSICKRREDDDDLNEECSYREDWRAIAAQEEEAKQKKEEDRKRKNREKVTPAQREARNRKRREQRAEKKKQSVVERRKLLADAMRIFGEMFSR